IGDVNKTAVVAGDQTAGVEPDGNRFHLLPAAVFLPQHRDGSLARDPSGVHAHGRAARLGLSLAFLWRVASPVGNVTAVGLRKTELVRSHADGDFLFELAVLRPEALHAVAAGDSDPQFTIANCDARPVGVA